MNILVIGAGYVGLSNALMISTKFKTKLIDIDENKIKQLQNGISPIKDTLIENYLTNRKLKIEFATSIDSSLCKVNAVVIATPTNFDSKTNQFDTRSIQKILNILKKKNFKNLVVIRSTVPIGFTEKMQKKYNFELAFFPEFLREGLALEDSLYPSRIVCGSKSKNAYKFLKILKQCSKKKKISSIVVSSIEAESIKLFSNAYLAMRIAFFNEVDSFSLSKNISALNIINGMSLDPRIGNFYNNPSFGFGGYCLPKDTKQLNSSFGEIPQNLIKATLRSNESRKDFITKNIIKKKISKVGIYRLTMKSGSDNWRESATLDILKSLKEKRINLIIYEPFLKKQSFMGVKVENNLDKFLHFAEIIVANRLDTNIKDKKNILFSRDLFQKD